MGRHGLWPRVPRTRGQILPKRIRNQSKGLLGGQRSARAIREIRDLTCRAKCGIMVHTMEDCPCLCFLSHSLVPSLVPSPLSRCFGGLYETDPVRPHAIRYV